ncbi:hypothetical protein [Amycolatopsis minnesotensis]|uniref:Uncharacterized protein n=1 Tax=Amycolatopsis minnesotensis TaxID=337894 RepID=A0ABN2R143_9PSEU
MNSTQDTSFGVRSNVHIEIDGPDKDPRFEAYLVESEDDCLPLEPRFTKPVAEQVVAWTNKVADDTGGLSICEWSQEGYVLVFTDSPFRPSKVVQPDEDGLYALGLGWAWKSTEVEL